jgi:hypothetical protein
VTRHISRLSIVFILMLAAATAGCYGSSTAPTTPPFTETTDQFSGTLKPLGTDTHTFMVNYSAAQSDASVTVTSLTSVATGAPENITIGVAFGSTNLGVCTPSTTVSNPGATVGTEHPTTGAPFVNGSYCVAIFDNPAAPTVTEPINYTLAVRHF